MNQKFQLRISTKGRAFQGRAAFEVANQIRKIADELEASPKATGRMLLIHDSNGMPCGKARIDHTDTK